MVEAPEMSRSARQVRPRPARRSVIRIAAIVAALVVLGLTTVYSGLLNVATTYPDRAPMAWLLSTIMDRSVQRHAAGIRAPSLDSPELMRTGFQHYREMCVACHGAPGVPADEIARGLNPRPPLLVESAGDWEPNELFWITKYGVRMTGMPGWGTTHSDDKIWAIVSFVSRLPKLSEDEYRALDREVPASADD